MITMRTESEPKQAMDRLRAGSEITVDRPDGTIVVSAERDGAFFSFTASHEDDTTENVEGIAVRRLVLRHGYRLD